MLVNAANMHACACGVRIFVTVRVRGSLYVCTHRNGCIVLYRGKEEIYSKIELIISY